MLLNCCLSLFWVRCHQPRNCGKDGRRFAGKWPVSIQYHARPDMAVFQRNVMIQVNNIVHTSKNRLNTS